MWKQIIPVFSVITVCPARFSLYFATIHITFFHTCEIYIIYNHLYSNFKLYWINLYFNTISYSQQTKLKVCSFLTNFNHIFDRYLLTQYLRLKMSLTSF